MMCGDEDDNDTGMMVIVGGNDDVNSTINLMCLYVFTAISEKKMFISQIFLELQLFLVD